MRILQQRNSEYGFSTSLLVGSLAVTALIGAHQVLDREDPHGGDEMHNWTNIAAGQGAGLRMFKDQKSSASQGSVLTDRLGPFPRVRRVHGEKPRHLPWIPDYLMMLSRNASCRSIISFAVFSCRGKNFPLCGEPRMCRMSEICI